jgi:hypothetical protein
MGLLSWHPCWTVLSSPVGLAASQQELEVKHVPSQQFFNLPKEKQQQIVQASLREFAEHGYDLASTNRIVEEAKISKGVVFRNLKMQKNAALRYTALFIFMQFGQRFLMSLTPPIVQESSTK